MPVAAQSSTSGGGFGAAASPPHDRRSQALPILDQIVVGVAGVLILAAVILTAIAPIYPSRGETAKDFASRFPPPAGGPASPGPSVPPPAAAPGTAAPSTQPSVGGGQLPAGMNGTWSGSLTQKNASNTVQYNVTITLTGGAVGSVVGTSSYPTVPCAGDLTLTAVGARVQVAEHITNGQNDCFDTTLLLGLDGSGNLTYHFDDVGYGTGDGTLTRQR